MRPFFPYYGSKWNVARYYPKPSGLPVIEPFAGSAGYSTFYEVPEAILVDKDPILAGVWSFLLKTTPSEIMALPEMMEVGDCVDDYSLPQEAKWLIGFWLNRGSASPKKTRTAYSARTDRSQLNWGLKAKTRIAEQLHLIKGWSVIEGSYDQAPRVDNATWFVDPPYVDKGRFYRTKFNDYPTLASWCSSLEGTVIVCEGPGADWLPFSPLGDFKTSKGHAQELLWLST